MPVLRATGASASGAHVQALFVPRAQRAVRQHRSALASDDQSGRAMLVHPALEVIVAAVFPVVVRWAFVQFFDFLNVSLTQVHFSSNVADVGVLWYNGDHISVLGEGSGRVMHDGVVIVGFSVTGRPSNGQSEVSTNQTILLKSYYL